MIGIYKITNPSGKIYIGQTVNIEKRFKEYKNIHVTIRQQIKIYNSLKKYGSENHIFEIIEECLLEQLDEREIYRGVYYKKLESEQTILEENTELDKELHIAEFLCKICDENSFVLNEQKKYLENISELLDKLTQNKILY